MDCNAYRILITGYLDRELSDDEMQMLKTHLQTCESCLTYLKRMEAMETVLKRYKLLQEVPAVPSNFAHNISVILQGVVKQEKVPFGAKVKRKYREFVLGIVEKWASSLKARPFAWMTSVSFLVVLLAGVVVVDIFQTMDRKKPLQDTKAPLAPVMQVAQKDKTPVEGKSVQFPAVASESEKWDETDDHALAEGDPIQYEDTPISTFRAAQPGRAFIKEEDKQPAGVEASRNRLMEDTEFVEVAEEAFVQFAKNESVSVEGYVYSHVITVSQNQFFDDVVFVGYVQDALFE
jgi:hypothetical protein